ncbi:tetraacyldisaccharide 4'-kinase [Caenimonas sp. SL110]|uniref:tetraacyldisaccharide 4'-kinase n=1 Tax=Caenimonas sp. SL110 TaxID=1450524 RepID=UPI000652E388|nr:tetraacyldisaccharide 4'-kinase [Caenimonas sp. SL110]
MGHALQRAWLRRGALARVLWPLSLVFGALSALRRLGFRSGLIKRNRMPVPVIVVGNVVAGGSGKTPVVIALVDHLRSRGINAAVVSRGYGRAATDCRQVHATSDARDVGDEPILISRACGVPVFVAPARADAARALLAAYPQVQVVVCDDGLQHYALARDIEICVFDDRGIGNGWLLPAGPLRERWPRDADLVLRTQGAKDIAGHLVGRHLASAAVRADGAKRALGQLRSERALIAVAGIARPQAFFDMLRTHQLLPVRTLALPDHAADCDYLSLLAGIPSGATLVCTLKDAVKLWKHRPDAWAVPLELDIAPEFWRELDALLQPLLDAKLSSGHGSQTA